MCGIAGILGFRLGRLNSNIVSMARMLAHRGPDDGGIWVDNEAGVSLAHRRLSVLDLSAAGHQPMISPSQRFVISYNGEIYNHLELRGELEADERVPAWRGHSDTETLLAGIDAWGLEKTLEKCVGMFAFALWDRRERSLILVRDRIGEKPLYYGWIKDTLVFGSELKAIRAYPGFDARIDRRALTLFLRHNCVPAPWSIYENIWKLPPGCFVRFDARNLAGERNTPGHVQAYWSARTVAEAGMRDPFPGNEEEATEELIRLIGQSLAGQRIADVPLGAFLSGGIDSSTVVALLQAQSTIPVRTFTIGFHEDDFNEAEQAHDVARHLGTDHTELYVTAEEARSVIPKLPAIYDEPFADSSQIPTYLVARLARRHVTVALSGDGGDELFGGYNRYFWVTRLWQWMAWVPRRFKSRLAGAILAVPPLAWNRFFSFLHAALPDGWRYGNPGDKLHKLAGLLDANRPEEVYHRLVSHWHDPARLVLEAAEPVTVLTEKSLWLDSPDLVKRMMYLDLVTYLPDDILVKVDRASMAVSLETRIPLLDHRIVEFAWSLPIAMKVRNGTGKRLLRRVLHRYVPSDLIERPKMGFGIPLDEWLRGPLREWAEELVSKERLRSEGYLDPAPVREKWEEHLSGRRNWQYPLWDVLMFQAWLETQ